MKYSGTLVKKEREKIFELFLRNPKLKFGEIEKALKIRSNKMSYHIDQMVKEKLLKKEGFFYQLTPKAEKYIPIFSHITSEQLTPLPIVLIALTNKDKILLIKRDKRPYKNYWSMLGGKILLEEDYKDASKRIVKDRTSLSAKFSSLNALLHERIKGDNMIKHSFMLFFTKMFTSKSDFKDSVHGTLKWFNLKELDNLKIIPSDKWLILNKLDDKLKVSNAFMNEKEGELSDFEIIS